MSGHLQYMDACIVGEYKYFSNLEFNGLFRENTSNDTIEFLGHFPLENIAASMLHRHVFHVDNALYFIPYMGKGVSSYNLKNKIFSFYSLDGKADITSFSNAFLLENKIIMVPANENTDIAVFDCRMKEIIYYPAIWDTVHEFYTDTIAVDIKAAVLIENILAIAIWNSNIVVSINTKDFSISHFEVPGNFHLRNISYFDKKIWATLVDQNIIINFVWGGLELCIFPCRDIEVIPKAMLVVEKLREQIIAIPGAGTKLLIFSRETHSFVDSGIIIQKEWLDDSESSYFIGYDTNETLVLYPRRCRGEISLSCKNKFYVNYKQIVFAEYDSIKQKVFEEKLVSELLQDRMTEEKSNEWYSLNNYIGAVLRFPNK